MPQPAALRAAPASTFGFASNTRRPPNSSTVSRKCPPGRSARRSRGRSFTPVLKSSAPWPGRGVHGAGARVERDVVAEHAERVARVERMLEADAARARAPFIRATGAPNGLAGDGSATVRREPFGDDHRAAVDVVRARSRTPDETRSPGSTESSTASSSRSGPRPSRPASAGTRCGQLAGALRRQRELDVDRRRRVILVLDFGFGERGAAVDAPVHRLLALVDEPLLDELARARARSPPGT